LFDAAIERLGRRAGRGVAGTQARLDDSRRGAAAARIQLEGEQSGALYLIAERGSLTTSDELPSVAVCYAFAVPRDAAERAVAWLQAGQLDEARVGAQLLRLGSAKAAQLFRDYPCTFDVRVDGMPDIGQLAARVALGVGHVPREPDFVVAAAWGDLEAARRAGDGPRELILSGRARIDGDRARAMMLAMTLAQLD
jgi:hypothetical protein